MVSSPQDRAVQSAGLIAATLGLSFTTDDRLMEIAMGPWEGLTWPEIETRWPGVAGEHDTSHFRIPGGEPYAEVAARARSWLDSLTRPTIAVSHGVFGRVLRTVYLGMEQGGYATLHAGGQASFYLLQDGRVEEVAV
jgi:probable phosphoglycerate mutase